jgi:hypothetical protein
LKDNLEIPKEKISIPKVEEDFKKKDKDKEENKVKGGFKIGFGKRKGTQN